MKAKHMIQNSGFQSKSVGNTSKGLHRSESRASETKESKNENLQSRNDYRSFGVFYRERGNLSQNVCMTV